MYLSLFSLVIIVFALCVLLGVKTKILKWLAIGVIAWVCWSSVAVPALKRAQADIQRTVGRF